MKILVAAAAILAMSLVGSVHAANPSDDIHRLVDDFQRAIVAKDGEALSAMFVPSGGAWFMVLSDESYARMKKKSPGASRFKQGSYADFVKYVATSKVPVEERFQNVRIETDGAIASVYFDFVFLSDSKENNRGVEAWHVIKTDDGWKISSMTYTVSPPDKG